MSGTCTHSARGAFAGALALAAVLTAAVATPGGFAGAATPPAGRIVDAQIEGPAPYQGQFLCRNELMPGVKAFRNLVLDTYPNTRSVSEVRACTNRTSEHSDGRAWDWGVNVENAKEKKQAESLIHWLTAPDEHGNDFAMARRLGVMYLIWNKRIWRAYSGEWGPYECSGVTLCHKDHVHFSFGWAGAYKKTSYWGDTVALPMPPPIPLFDGTGKDPDYRVTVRADRERTWGDKALGGGLLYSVRAKRVWRFGAKEHQRADAACRMHKDGTWQRSDSLRMSGVWNWTPATDTGGGCNTADHTYVATFTPWVTDAVSFTISDAKTGDNDGSVKILIRRVL
ncbi:MAG: hypothetical protein ACT4P1_02830 [Sporichthyaceae bacterium]